METQTDNNAGATVYATYPQRILALLIDAAFLYATFFALTRNWYLSLFLIFYCWIYFTICYRFFGRTLGERTLGLRLALPDGEFRLKWWRVWCRAVGNTMIVFPLFAGISATFVLLNVIFAFDQPSFREKGLFVWDVMIPMRKGGGTQADVHPA